MGRKKNGNQRIIVRRRYWSWAKLFFHVSERTHTISGALWSSMDDVLKWAINLVLIQESAHHSKSRFVCSIINRLLPVDAAFPLLFPGTSRPDVGSPGGGYSPQA